MADKEWRPDDWMKISNRIRAHFDQARSVIVNRDVYEAGASAMLEARDKDWIAWGESKCLHQHLISNEQGFEVEDMLRKDCPICWAERKKEIGQ